MRILTVHEAAPNFPASDTLPGATRYEVADKWVDAIGGKPTEADVQAFLNPLPTPAQKIAALERDDGQGVFVRGVREFMLGVAEGLAVVNPQLSQQMLATPGMRKVKELDDKIKELRKQL